MAIGRGSSLGYEDGSSIVTIGKVRSGSHPEIPVSRVDKSNWDSPNNAKEYEPGLQDFPELSFELIYDASILEDVTALIGISKNYVLTINGGGEWAFPGYISSVGGGTIPDGEEITYTIKIQPTTKPTFSAV